nr:EOG090X0NTZ [Sida crystallina]
MNSIIRNAWKCTSYVMSSARSVGATLLKPQPQLQSPTSSIIQNYNQLLWQNARSMVSLLSMHLKGPHIKKRPSKNPLGGAPMLKGVILKTLIRKPKKPNSANRKCVLVRLSNGKEMVAYVPGEGHNLQEHNIVLVRVGRVQDLPGVKLKCIRGVYDLNHVIKKK